jgi:hypothetical protein
LGRGKLLSFFNLYKVSVLTDDPVLQIIDAAFKRQPLG